MTYTPSESEKSLATIIQAASIPFFCLPALIASRTRWWQSPYVRFWGKGNMIWSMFLMIPSLMFLILDLWFVPARAPLVVIWSVHTIMVIMCTFASMFNRPVGYFIVTNRFCMREMANVYGSALSGPLGQ